MSKPRPTLEATMAHTLKGQLTTWEKGERVQARRSARNRYVIERLVWRVPKLPLFNQCANVPRSFLKFT